MGWQVNLTHNSIQISAECAQELTDQVKWAAWDKDYDEDAWAACEDEWSPVPVGEPGLLRFDGEAMEHIDYITSRNFSGPFFEIMEKHKVNGEVHFADAEHDSYWGHRFVDGKHIPLTGVIKFVPDDEIEND